MVIVRAIKNNSALPRILQKNGKRSKAEFEQCKDSLGGIDVSSPSPKISDASDVCQAVEHSVLENSLLPDEHEQSQLTQYIPTSINDKAFKSAVLREINSLKQHLTSLQSEISQTRGHAVSKLPPSEHSTCWLYVCVRHAPVHLESLLSCRVLCFLKVRRGDCQAFQVKISSSNLNHVLECGARSCDFIDLWRPKSEIHPGPGPRQNICGNTERYNAPGSRTSDEGMECVGGKGVGCTDIGESDVHSVDGEGEGVDPGDGGVTAGMEGWLQVWMARATTEEAWWV